TSYALDGSDRATQVRLPLGQRTTFSYATNQTVITNPRGHRTTIGLASGQIQSVQDAAGNRTTYAFDSSGLKSVVDGRGNRTTFLYASMLDRGLRLKGVVRPLSGRLSFTYDSSTGRVQAVIDPLSRRSTLTWATGNRTGLKD